MGLKLKSYSIIDYVLFFMVDVYGGHVFPLSKGVAMVDCPIFGTVHTTI